MTDKQPDIGLFIIGDEILSGRRQDRHLGAVIDRLQTRGLLLSWSSILGDDMELLVRRFRETFESEAIVFSCGGIGGTPDDLTRLAVAKALEIDVERHPEGIKLLERFARKKGRELLPEHYRMIEFPAGAELIPNPVNSIPGFSIRNHHFVPGFPDMAWPMIDWVLNNHYPDLNNANYQEYSVMLYDVPESEVIPIMEMLQADFKVKAFSLPRMIDTGFRVELGIKGQAEVLCIAKTAMLDTLNQRGYRWEDQ